MNKPKATMVMFNDYKNCFLSISALPDEKKGNKISSTMCFCVINKEGSRMVEWEPEHGPITIIEEVVANDERFEDPDFAPGLREHWFFNNQVNTDWTQRNVDSNKLPESYINQDFEHIFKVLESYL